MRIKSKCRYKLKIFNDRNNINNISNKTDHPDNKQNNMQNMKITTNKKKRTDNR